MNVDELRIAKHALEQQMLSIVRAFQDATGTVVRHVSIEQSVAMRRTAGVCIDVPYVTGTRAEITIEP